MKVYHLAYDASAQSLNIHFGTRCNLKCRACYVPYNWLDFGLVDDPVGSLEPEKELKPPAGFIGLKQILEKIEPLSIRSAVFVGTEPSLDPEMPRLAYELKTRFGSYNILLTNGFKLADMKSIDEVIFSIKAVDPEKHIAYTGRSNHNILENFHTIYSTGIKIQAETVLIPGLVDAAEIEEIARFIAGIDKSIPLRIDAFFPVPGCTLPAATRDQVEEAARKAEKHLNKIHCLTLDMQRIGDKAVQIY